MKTQNIILNMQTIVHMYKNNNPLIFLLLLVLVPLVYDEGASQEQLQFPPVMEAHLDLVVRYVAKSLSLYLFCKSFYMAIYAFVQLFIA